MEIYEKINVLQQSKTLKVKFIRLGTSGSEFKNCRDNKLIYFGFDSQNILELCKQIPLAKDRLETHLSKFTKTSDTFRQYKDFFEDDGRTLWITTNDRVVYFGFTDGKTPFVEANKTYRKMEFGWHGYDRSSTTLNITTLNGGITKTLSYQSTICDFSPKYAELLVNRILNKPNVLKDQAKTTYQDLEVQLQHLIQQFHEKDFELLIELIISRAGLKRVGVAGKHEELIDLELQHPITQEFYIAQVKSQTNQKTFQDVVAKYESYRKNNQECKLIFAYHTSKSDLLINSNISKSIILWDAKKIAKLAIDNGLASWVIDTAPV